MIDSLDIGIALFLSLSIYLIPILCIYSIYLFWIKVVKGVKLRAISNRIIYSSIIFYFIHLA